MMIVLSAGVHQVGLQMILLMLCDWGFDSSDQNQMNTVMNVEKKQNKYLKVNEGVSMCNIGRKNSERIYIFFLNENEIVKNFDLNS